MPSAPVIVSRRLTWAVGAVAGLCALAACSPTLDWRELRLEGPGLIAMFPCRPVAQSRQLTLAGTAVTMKLLACEAGGSTFAVSQADVSDPAAVGPALAALRDASAAKFGGEPAAATGGAWSLAGMTPQPAAGRWRLVHQRPDGGSLRMETAVFARGTWVMQATVIGAASTPQATMPFFEGLRFVP